MKLLWSDICTYLAIDTFIICPWGIAMRTGAYSKWTLLLFPRLIVSQDAIHAGLNDRVNSLSELSEQERFRAISVGIQRVNLYIIESQLWRDIIECMFVYAKKGFYDGLKGINRFSSWIFSMQNIRCGEIKKTYVDVHELYPHERIMMNVCIKSRFFFLKSIHENNLWINFSYFDIRTKCKEMQELWLT